MVLTDGLGLMEVVDGTASLMAVAGIWKMILGFARMAVNMYI